MKEAIEFFRQAVLISHGSLLVKNATVSELTGSWPNLIPEMIFMPRHVSSFILHLNEYVTYCISEHKLKQWKDVRRVTRSLFERKIFLDTKF